MPAHSDKEQLKKEHMGTRLFTLKSGLLGALLIIIGLMLALAYQNLFTAETNKGIIAALVHHLSTAFLIAGLWHSIEVFFTRQEFLEVLAETNSKLLSPLTHSTKTLETQIHDLSDQVRAEKHERRLGFVRSYVESHPELYESIISQSLHLTMVVNNGYVWVQTHRDELKERFADETKTTRILVIDPTSDAARVMEAHEHLAIGSYKLKVEETLNLLAGIADNDNRLEVYSISVPIGQAIFLSETRALIVPRFLLEPSVPPVFEFHKNNDKKSYYRRIFEDVEHLIRDSGTQRLAICPPSEPPAAPTDCP